MYTNKQVDQWLNAAQTEMNAQKRQDLYTKATIQIMRDATWVPVYYPVNYFAVQPWIHGFYMNPVMLDPLMSIWVDPSHANS